MTDTNLNIWSSELDSVTDASTLFSPFIPPQPMKIQLTLPSRTRRNDSLAHARVLAIFRSGKFPNKVDTSSVVFEELEQEDDLELGYSFIIADEEPNICPDFEEDLFDSE